MRLLIRRSDDTALERVLNLPTRGIGNKTVEQLRDLARTRQVPMWQAIVIARDEQLFSSRALKALSGFTVLVDELDSATLELPLEELT